MVIQVACDRIEFRFLSLIYASEKASSIAAIFMSETLVMHH